jgi:hypothetical protein
MVVAFGEILDQLDSNELTGRLVLGFDHLAE